MNTQIFKYKLVFVGDQSVGKTSIINRFIYDTFSGTDQPTVGIDFVSKTLQIDNKTIRLQLWDTAGQERFRSLIPSYVRDSHAVIVVYDITNQNSYQNINKWIEYVREERGNDVIIFFVGNKIDAEESRQVTTEDGIAKSKEFEVCFQELSAKTGENVNLLFKQLTQMLSNSSDKATPGITTINPSSNSNANNNPSSNQQNQPQNSSNDPSNQIKSGGGQKLNASNLADRLAQNKKGGCC